MTIGIFYFSRTGNTKHAATLLQEKLKERGVTAKLVEIQTEKKIVYITAGSASFRQKELPIKNPGFDLKEFDTVLVGVPVWAGKPSPFYKTFFKKAINGKGKKVGLFVTGGGTIGSQTIASEMMRQEAKNQAFIPIEGFLALQMENGEIKDGAQIIPHFLESVLSQ